MLKNEVLYALEQKKGDVMTGGELAERFGVSRTAIWKAIHTLNYNRTQRRLQAFANK